MFRSFIVSCILLFGLSSVFAQIKPSGVADTSFTIIGSFKKELKYYPNIKVADSTMPASVTVARNIAYSSVTKDRKLLLDVYSKKGRQTKAPAILMVFGGGWRSGDHGDAGAVSAAGGVYPRELSRRGCAVPGVCGV